MGMLDRGNFLRRFRKPQGFATVSIHKRNGSNEPDKEDLSAL